MTSDAPNEERVELRDGCTLCIRPLRRGEVGLVRELYARLSLRTRHHRFLSPMPVVSESQLDALAMVDDGRRFTLIAQVDRPHGGDVVALGTLTGIGDERAEAGLVVADAWQRRGIGVALAGRLLRAGESRGFRQFVTHGLWDNPAVRPLLGRTAEIQSATMSFGVYEIAFVRRKRDEAPRRTQRDEPRAGFVRRDANAMLEQTYQRILFTKGRSEL